MNKLIFILLTSVSCACTNVVMNHSGGPSDDVSDTTQTNETTTTPTVSLTQ